MRDQANRQPGNGRRQIDGNAGDHSSIKGWASLTLALVGLILFIYVIGPAGLKTPLLEPMATFIQENDINANAYFYTEVDEFFVAERHMREHLGYMARGGH